MREVSGASERRVVIAIDGPAGAGKSTIARRVAARLGYLYIDTGAMYRAIALWALRQKHDPTDAPAMEQLAQAAGIDLLPEKSRVLLNDEDVTEAIRTPEVTDAASKVAAIAAVRRAMVQKQRAFRERASVVMEGRDIGTVVFPDANVKIFLDADAEERVRRVSGDAARGRPVKAVAERIRERDHRDSTRPDSPLVQAPDAVYIDSTDKTLEQVEEEVLAAVRAKVSNGKEIPR